MIPVPAVVEKSTKIVMEKTSKRDLFLQKLKSIYPDEYEIIFQTIQKSLPTVFRINLLKTSETDALKELENLGFQIQKGPLENSYIVRSFPLEIKLSETDLFNEGKIYIQNLSSMVPALVLNTQSGDMVLDLCAAPGSKTSQIADLVGNKAKIYAVESNTKRFYTMKKNFLEQGLEAVITVNARAEALPFLYPSWINYFDRILCDVPCTNEGLIRDLQHYDFNYWNPKTSKRLSQLQKKILASGIKLLKPGGVLVYSTCTYSIEENENVVGWALKKFPEVHLSEINLNLENVVDGMKDKTTLAKRILPDENFMEFFLAKLMKEQ